MAEEVEGGPANTPRVPSPVRADQVRPASVRMAHGPPASVGDEVSSSG